MRFSGPKAADGFVTPQPAKQEHTLTSLGLQRRFLLPEPRMTKPTIRLDECGLLTRRNAMRYCGQLGDERFDREVVPACMPRFIGHERFYSRQDLDRWIEGLPIDRLGTRRQPSMQTNWRQKLRDDL